MEESEDEADATEEVSEEQIGQAGGEDEGSKMGGDEDEDFSEVDEL